MREDKLTAGDGVRSAHPLWFLVREQTDSWYTAEQSGCGNKQQRAFRSSVKEDKTDSKSEASVEKRT